MFDFMEMLKVCKLFLHKNNKKSDKSIVFIRTSSRKCSTYAHNFSQRSSMRYKCILLQIMGKWYVVEILEHRTDPLKPVSSSVYVVDSCPIVKLKPLDHAVLKLLWTEEAGNLEYTFRIPDISRRRGLWLTTTLQNGIYR